jgi:hypothetical protein
VFAVAAGAFGHGVASPRGGFVQKGVGMRDRTRATGNGL